MAFNFLNKTVTSVIITHSKGENITHSESCKGWGLILTGLKDKDGNVTIVTID